MITDDDDLDFYCARSRPQSADSVCPRLTGVSIERGCMMLAAMGYRCDVDRRRKREATALWR